MLTMIALPLLYAIFDDVTGFRFKPFGLLRKRAVPVLLLLLIPVFSVHAQQKPISLNEAIELAKQNNAGLKSFNSNIKQQKALLPAAINIEKTTVYYEYDQNNVANNGYPIGVLGVEQSFEFPTVYAAQQKVAKRNVELANYEYEKASFQLTKEVSIAYVRIVYLRSKMQKYNMIDSSYENYTRSAKLQLEAGEISKLDFLNAQSKHSLLKLKMKQLSHDAEMAIAAFNSLLQSDVEYTAADEPLAKIETKIPLIENEPGFQVLNSQTGLNEMLLKVEKNKLLPDITLGYFNGTNNYDNAQNYQGVHIGLALPLFFGNQKAKIEAARHGQQLTWFQQKDYKIRFASRLSALFAEQNKYRETLQYFEETGISLSKQIIETANKSYANGEIDFFRFVHSIESAIEIEIEYLDQLLQYNMNILEINYLTL
jgi:cobalt-zinc-cadmium resistance protein CzcA